MQKSFIFFILLTLFSLQAHANSSDKKHYLSTDIGFGIGTPIASLGYGRNFYSKAGAYFGFVEIAGILYASAENLKNFDDSMGYFSLSYGYEWMRDKKFSFGLSAVGDWGLVKTGKEEDNLERRLTGSIGIFAKSKLTEKWSSLVKVNVGLLVPFGPNMQMISLGARYHF